MTTFEVLSLAIAAGGAIMTATFSFLALQRAASSERQAIEAKKAAADVKEQVQELHITVNSRMTELLAAAKGEARGEGHAEGRAEVKMEVATGAIPPLPTPDAP